MSKDIKIVQFNDITAFFEKCEDLLMMNESFHNLKVGLANAVKQNDMETTDPLFYGIFEDEKICGCALRTNKDRPLAITKLSPDALLVFIDFLTKKNVQLHGVVGEVETAKKFNTIWTKQNHLSSKLIMHLGVYEASAIKLPNIEGELIVGSTNENEVMFEYIQGFVRDCFPNEDKKAEDIQKLCERYIQNQMLYLLRNKSGKIVAMAANTRGSINGGTISLVYTPPSERGNGYGSLVTALVAQKILTQKKVANLFTDLANPTSNSIYQKIGFQMIGENIHFDFENK